MYTKFRPWKAAKRTRTTDAADDTTNIIQHVRAITDREEEAFSSPALRFVNTSHPSEATSVEVIGTIRSHVAREIHATRRHRKKVATQARSDPKTRTKELGSPGSPRKETSVCGDNLDDKSDAVYQPDPRGRHGQLPSPATLLDSARRDQLNRLARPLNDAESFLIDHYLTVIAPEAFDLNNEAAAKVGSAWVPFALSDKGLLSSLLLITCRCLELLSIDSWHNNPLDSMAVRYKGDCLRFIRAALHEEGTLVSTTTIARVMVLCSYELKFGDNDVARCHAKAIAKMVELRGGFGTVSKEGYAGEVIASFCAKLEAWSGNAIAQPPAVNDY